MTFPKIKYYFIRNCLINFSPHCVIGSGKSSGREFHFIFSGCWFVCGKKGLRNSPLNTNQTIIKYFSSRNPTDSIIFHTLDFSHEWTDTFFILECYFTCNKDVQLSCLCLNKKDIQPFTFDLTCSLSLPLTWEIRKKIILNRSCFSHKNSMPRKIQNEHMAWIISSMLK